MNARLFVLLLILLAAGCNRTPNPSTNSSTSLAFTDVDLRKRLRIGTFSFIQEKDRDDLRNKIERWKKDYLKKNLCNVIKTRLNWKCEPIILMEGYYIIPDYERKLSIPITGLHFKEDGSELFYVSAPIELSRYPESGSGLYSIKSGDWYICIDIGYYQRWYENGSPDLFVPIINGRMQGRCELWEKDGTGLFDSPVDLPIFK